MQGLLDVNRRLVEAVLLKQDFDVLQCAIKLVACEQLPELKLRSIDDLIGVRAVWRTFDVDVTNEEIWLGDECQDHLSIAGLVGFYLNVGEAPGGIQLLDTLSGLVPVQRLAHL